MNEYLEETLEVQDLDTYKKKKLIFFALSLASIVFMALGLLFAPVMVEYKDGQAQVNCTSISFLPNLILLILYFGLFLGLTIFFTRKKNRALVEYDYVIKSDKISITKIFNREQRRYGDRIFYNSIVKIGRVGSGSYQKLNSNEFVKTIDFTVNKTPYTGKNFYYIATKSGEGDFLYKLECTEKFMVQILKTVGKSVIEEDYK